MNSVCLRSRTEFINRDTDSLISSSIVSTENKTKIFLQQYISYSFYHLTSREYGKRPTLPSPRQELCTTYDACRPAMRVNIHLPTVLNSEYFHPTKSHCIFMCILGLHPRDMAPRLVVNAIHHFHTDHNAPSIPPKILHDHCSQFLLGITVVPREIQDNGYDFFFWGGGGGCGGLTRCMMVHVKMVNKN